MKLSEQVAFLEQENEWLKYELNLIHETIREGYDIDQVNAFLDLVGQDIEWQEKNVMKPSQHVQDAIALYRELRPKELQKNLP